MLKRIFIVLLITLLLLSVAVAEAEQKVMVVQSLRIKPYEEVLRSFKSACGCKIERLIISEESADLIKEVRRVKPDLILAVGINALSKAKEIKDIPIVYAMVPNPQSIISREDNITGVSMIIPPERQLGLLRRALGDVYRVGLLYDPAKTGYLVEEARHSSKKLGITLITRKVHNPREVHSKINTLKDDIDAFWMLPDTTVITPETVELIFLFSLENKIPVLTFSDKYLELGAVVSVSIDASDIGRQAGVMAKEILSGKSIRNIARADAWKAVLTINRTVAKKLGISVEEELISKADIINR